MLLTNMATGEFLIFGGLSALDKAELSDQFGAAVSFVEPEVPEGNLAEPATIAAVVSLGSLAIGVLAAYVSKRRRQYLLRERFRRTYPDGSYEEHSFEIKASDEDEVKAEVIKQLGGWLKTANSGSSGK